jgi:peptide/nickel transport system permease protein
MKSAVDQLVSASPRAVPDMIFEAAVLESSSSPSLSGVPHSPRAPRSRAREQLKPSRLSQLRLSDLLVPVALSLLLFVAVCAAFPAAIAPYLPTDMQTDAILSEPGRAHWFGTDQFGRDVFSLVVYGARQSVLIGVFAVLISCSVGVSIGLLAGYAGGWLDTALMRFIDMWMAIPNILLAIALSSVLGPSLVNTIFAISITTIPRYARVLRGQALSVRSRPFIEATSFRTARLRSWCWRRLASAPRS